MKLHKTWLILMLVALVAFMGCSDDDDPVTPPGATDFETMAAAGTAYVNDNTICPGVINAQVVYDNLADYTVIDIRSEAAYLAGHIPGAYHSGLSTLIADLANIPSDKPYVIACYSGQSAGHAKIAMEMLGYEDVYSLLFGMSSWSLDLDSWSGKCANELAVAETDPQNDNLTEHSFPEIAGSVEERVAAMLAAGFKAKSYADIETNLEEYFILNYFGEDDYLGDGEAGVPGHIPGAFQFTPYASMGMDEMLMNIPMDMPVIVYCWTGQHSSQITAYLNMCGYEAYSLKNGSNNLFYDALTAHKWGPGAQHDFELETGAMPDETFETIATALADYLNDSADCPGVVNAQVVYDNLEDYTVIDIRQLVDYDAGHIAGAYHSSLATLLTDVGTTIPTDNPFVIACYSGQSAGHAKIAMELAGYENTQSLLFGMSSWSSDPDLDKWTSKCLNLLPVAETENQNGDLVGYNYPSLTGETVASRVDAMLAAGFKATSYTAIQDNLEDYFIVNYFGEADYLGDGDSGVPGHIPGAFQFTPYASMGLGQMLANLPTDMPIVVYCWTGQHSSQVTAYLNMLGYDAYSLANGSNNLFYDSLTAHKWGPGAMHDFPLEVTPGK